MKIKILVLLIAGLFSFITAISAQETTTSLLESAQIKAKEEGKAVFIKFEASWCGWCHKMTKDMKAEGTKKFFEENYVIVPIVVNETKENEKLENPGSKNLLKKYEGDKAGLPFWVILDSDLKVITNSFDAKGQNLGGPASNEEVNEFIKKINKSAKTVSKKDVKNIKKQFIQ
ncbi:thioredoxin family protein [Polaribacter sp. IC073]|uniref:thioredoxin family protein n=1 Tax=Polaribacter sp. IC073 TaxID=2508540 RepID=UPI0011BDFB4C|nr:thioredoxin family protein [Polaribacter sp. IC073]TXD48441.1 thioredoxin family protein [Polaribacter sp. IC073]